MLPRTIHHKTKSPHGTGEVFQDGQRTAGLRYQLRVEDDSIHPFNHNWSCLEVRDIDDISASVELVGAFPGVSSDLLLLKLDDGRQVQFVVNGAFGAVGTYPIVAEGMIQRMHKRRSSGRSRTAIAGATRAGGRAGEVCSAHGTAQRRPLSNAVQRGTSDVTLTSSTIMSSHASIRCGAPTIAKQSCHRHGP